MAAMPISALEEKIQRGVLTPAGRHGTDLRGLTGGNNMNSWLIWVVWGAVTFVAVLLGFVGRHFSLRTLRYVTAITAAVLVVLVTRYGLTHSANPAPASSDLANSFTQGADELSAAFFHPLLLVLPGSEVPAPGPGRIGWL